jgi:hypothetical protein
MQQSEHIDLDKNIERAWSAVYTHARQRIGTDDDMAWSKKLQILLKALSDAYSKLKDHIYPRGG